jgi:hypothetical protein
MGSGGKGGAGGGSYNYFGRVAAVVGIGPLVMLKAVIVDGKAIYEGSLALSTDSTDVTSSIDGKYVSDGYLKLLRGTDTQTMPTEFSHLPNYRGLAVLLLNRFLFGKEKTTVPNIEIIAVRKPVVSTDLVSGTHNNLTDDGQCNPVAFLAEIFTSPFGAFRFDVSRFVASDWLAAAAWAYARQSRIYCSPFFNSQTDARKVAAELLAMFDGALYFDTQGRLGLRLLKPGVDPGGLPLLDAPTWSETGVPKQDGTGWSEVPARIDVEFYDSARKYKRVPEPAKNLIASRVLGLEDTRTVSMPHVTRRQQAADWGNELVRRSLKPAGPIKLSVRRAVAKAMALEPGKKVLIDTDPEPGGAGLAQLCVIEETSVGPTGPMKLTVRPDTLSEATPYTPDYAHEPDEPPAVRSIEHALVIPLPPLGFDGGLSFAVLATRRDADIVGMRVFFDAEEDGDYADLGTQTGFACRMTVDADFDEAADTVRLELTDGEDGLDAYLAGLTAGSEIAARNDVLYLILANLDATDGPVTVGADGQPEMEILSVVSRTAVSPGVFDYTVLRGRRGLRVREWTAASAAWIIPGASLIAWTHEALATMMDASATGFVRLVAYRADAEDEGLSIPTRPLTIPAGYDLAPKIAWTTPADSGADTTSSTYSVEFTVTDNEGDLVSLRVESRLADGTGQVIHLDQTFAASGSYVFGPTALPFALGTHELTVTAEDAAGHKRQSVRHITRLAPASTVPPPPTFDPPSGTPVASSQYRNVTITAADPSHTLNFQIRSIGLPVGPGGGSSVGTASVPVRGGQRIWARTVNTTTGEMSAYVASDYPVG